MSIVTDQKAIKSIQIMPISGWEFPSPVEIWNFRELLFVMIKSYIKGKYRQSALSTAYLFIQPLLSVGIFSFIFSRIAKIDVGDIPYPLFSVVGVTSWNFFNRSLNDGSSSLVTMSPVLAKVYMPRLIVVLVSICLQLFEYLIAFSMVAVFFIYFGMSPSIKLLLLPLAIFANIIFSMSIVLWLANLNVRFRDISMLLPGVIQILFYATPVVYPLAVVPEYLKWLFQLNPMTSVLEFMRYCLFENYPLPDMKYVLINTCVVIVLFVFGLIIFNRYSKTIVDRL